MGYWSDRLPFTVPDGVGAPFISPQRSPSNPLNQGSPTTTRVTALGYIFLNL
ncbi:MAG: hypothetical protein JO011_06675 [Ktedonobacteraceae bacterium]|nr:hypothetical protein [Ktedonobacteraceae bacterium]